MSEPCASPPVFRLVALGKTYGEGAATVHALREVNLEVVLPLLSKDALRIPVGSLVRLGAWAGGGSDAPELQGRVRMVEPMATTKVSALGLEEQRVNLVIDPDQALPAGDGYTVRAQVVLYPPAALHDGDKVRVGR